MNGRGIRNEAPKTDRKQQEEQIMFGLMLRDENRYGRFVAECEGIGKVTVEIEQCGFGELISIYKKGEPLITFDTLKDDDAMYEETDDYLLIDEYKIRKPFGKCLKRYH